MSPTVLILGAGPGIGAHSASLFGVAGYNVVTASRKLQDNTKSGSYLELHVDLAKPETIRPLLQKVKGFFGHPDVVIYNGAAMTLGPAEDPLSTLSIDTIEHDTAVNVTSALMAAHEAVKGWNEDPGNSNKTFIYTGNRQNVMADPKALTFGMAKTAAAKMMWDCCTAYAPKRYKFYFTDQRKPDGSPARELMDPEARAELYVELAEDPKQRPWHYTFVQGEGYVDFRESDKAWNVDG